MPRGSDACPSEGARVHQEAFCRSFLRDGRRERMLAKPEEFGSRLHHDLPRMLRPGRCLALSPPVLDARLSVLVRALTQETQCVYLGSGLDEGRYPIAEVINEMTSNHSAVASIEAGVLALYVTEGCPRPDWYVLCSDAMRLKSAAAAWARSSPR